MAPSLRLCAVAALVLPAPALAQSPRIDPALAQRLAAYEVGLPPLPGAAQTQGTDDPLDERLGLVVRTSDMAALRRSGVTVEAQFDGFAVVRALPSQVEVLLETPGVSRVTMGQDRHLHNDVAASLVGARELNQGLLGGTAYTGAGAVVCVFDSGIDWKHLDFRSTVDPTKSRILRLYDMTLTAKAGEAPPAGKTVGVEYTQAQLNDELDGTPAGLVRSKDTNGHGSHVAGTAAGNGGSVTPRQHVGMAPDADLVVVKGGNGSFSYANILSGISYCDSVATVLGKPMVMNMSLGSDDGPHDGQDEMGEAITQMVTSKPGRVVVQSAGNSGADLIHRGGTLAPGASVTMSFDVPATGSAGDPGFGVDIWTKGRNLTLIVEAPNGSQVTQPAGGQGTQTIVTQGRVFLFNYLITGTGRWDGDLDRELYVSTSNTGTPRTVAGTWKIILRNDDTVADEWHAWMIDGTVRTQAVTFTNADASYTVGNAAPEAISVGSYVHRWSWKNADGTAYSYTGSNRTDLRSDFSSQGPSRDGRAMPDLVAPGQNMISVRSANAPASAVFDMSATHTGMQGTSMAAPVVTGSVALLLAANPSLTYADVKTLLRDNATVDTYVADAGAVPNNEFGAGKLNVYQAMARLVNPASTSTSTVVQYDQSAGATLGDEALAAGQNALLRFQSATTGRLRGLSFHTGTVGVPSGGYTLRLWADNGGTPGVQMGPDVTVPASAVLAYSWNYVGTDAIASALVGATDYFVSVTPNGSGGGLLHDGANSGRSYTAPEATPPTPQGESRTQNIGALAPSAGDLLVRPVVSSDESALPVELVLFEGAQAGRTAALAWMTASETNNAGWGVEQMGQTPAEWTELGFVRGAGTTGEAQRYGFTTAALVPGRHTFRLRQMDTDGTVRYSGALVVEIGVDRALALLPAGPNPFSGQTALLLTVPQDGPAQAALYDVLGRRVQTLFDGAAVAGEAHTLAVDGASLAPGTYFVRAEAAGRSVQRTLVVAR